MATAVSSNDNGVNNNLFCIRIPVEWGQKVDGTRPLPLHPFVPQVQWRAFVDEVNGLNLSAAHRLILRAVLGSLVGTGLLITKVLLADDGLMWWKQASPESRFIFVNVLTIFPMMVFTVLIGAVLEGRQRRQLCGQLHALAERTSDALERCATTVGSEAVTTVATVRFRLEMTLQPGSSHFPHKRIRVESWYFEFVHDAAGGPAVPRPPAQTDDAERGDHDGSGMPSGYP